MSVLVNTTGLVLRTTPYAETSVIARIFTRELGVRSYILKGVRGRGNRVKQNLLQPLSYLDMTVYNNPKSDINYIKELRPATHFNNIMTDSVRSSMIFFINEVAYKTLREDERNEALFDHIVATLHRIDESRPRSNAPIDFLILAAQHLGIAPRDNFGDECRYFDIEEGLFAKESSGNTLDQEQSYLLHTHLQTCRHGSPDNGSHRNEESRDSRLASYLTSSLLHYYQVHLSGFKDFKSHEILHSVLKP